MDSYLDFGSDSDEDDGPNDGNQLMELDSDEEERDQNDTILKMLMQKSDSTFTKSKKEQVIEDFEAEMEAELDRRALEVEKEGGVKLQESLSRSSSSSSLNKMVVPPQTSKSPIPGPSASKRPRKGIMKRSNNDKSIPNSSSPSKAVKFSENVESVEGDSISSTTNHSTGEEPEPMAIASENGAIASEEGPNSSKKRYEDIYFDSDESEGDDEVTKKTRRDQREFLSNDDLFYDPKSDTKDQAWVDKKRRQYYAKNKLTDPNSNPSRNTSTSPAAAAGNNHLPPDIKPLPSSDAVLNCPACFTVLCLDCQRHEFYNNQYRAMFVMNCIVNSEELIYAPLKERKPKKGKQGQSSNTLASADGNDKFSSVKCKVCNTQLGAYDQDEVYHFVNVLASHS